MFTVCHYLSISKSSRVCLCFQKWHIPSRSEGINPRSIQDVVVQKPAVSTGKTKKRDTTDGRQLTFYNPLRWSDVRLADQLCPYFDSLSWPEKPQYAQLWSPGVPPVFVDSKVGQVPKGSVLS